MISGFPTHEELTYLDHGIVTRQEGNESRDDPALNDFIDRWVLLFRQQPAMTSATNASTNQTTTHFLNFMVEFN